MDTSSEILRSIKLATEIACNSNITKYARKSMIDDIEKDLITKIEEDKTITESEAFKMVYDVKDSFISIKVLVEVVYTYESKPGSYNESFGI